MDRKNAWEKYPQDTRDTIMQFCEAYRQFLSACKTERECTEKFVQMAKDAGFCDIKEIAASGKTLKPADKVYAVNKGKGLAMFVIGQEPIEQGMNILGAHIDSPRLDLKQNPLYEDTEMAMLDTHYYGGVKKYQWVALPLALHGVFVKKDGTKVPVSIGDQPGDPVFGVSDLLIHLAGE